MEAGQVHTQGVVGELLEVIVDDTVEADAKLHQDRRDVLTIQATLDGLHLLLYEGDDLGTGLVRKNRMLVTVGASE